MVNGQKVNFLFTFTQNLSSSPATIRTLCPILGDYFLGKWDLASSLVLHKMHGLVCFFSLTLAFSLRHMHYAGTCHFITKNMAFHPSTTCDMTWQADLAKVHWDSPDSESGTVVVQPLSARFTSFTRTADSFVRNSCNQCLKLKHDLTFILVKLNHVSDSFISSTLSACKDIFATQIGYLNV